MRSALLYLVLVGGPLLVLLGILQAGAAIVPPPSIGGTWSIEEPLPGEIGRCVGSPASLEISQSGVRAEALLTPARVGVPVELRADSIVGIAKRAGGGDCLGSRISVAASVAGDERAPRELSGILTLADCGACVPAPFRAVRVARPTR